MAGSKHRNNFGVLRLLFATLVIVSHAPELVDGNRSRELLTMVFGTLSFGEVAVDGFFIVSGYLITKSFAATARPQGFVVRRALRIVPGFVVSFGLCLLVLPVLLGSPFLQSSYLLHNLGRLLLLQPPDGPDVFRSLPYPHLNAAMWTISYEVRCYVAVLALGLTTRAVPVSPAKLRVALLIGVVAALTVNALDLLHDVDTLHQSLFGRLNSDVRFGAAFGTGALFHLYRDRMSLTGRGAALAAGGLVAGLFSPTLAEAAFIVCGGYLTLWFALRARVVHTALATDDLDLSYGLYLYAWPIQNSLILLYPGVPPLILGLVTLAGAAAAGFLSWRLIEQPAMAMIRSTAVQRWRAATGAGVGPR